MKLGTRRMKFRYAEVDKYADRFCSRLHKLSKRDRRGRSQQVSVPSIGEDNTWNSGGGYNVPVGGIIAWYGSSTTVPQGWAICNGTNGTPDLRNRFIVGAGDTYATGATGGADSVNISHTHTIDSAGSHNHTGTTDYAGLHTHDAIGDHTHSAGTLDTDSDSHTHDTISNHTHGDGSYASASVGHTHGSGTLRSGTPSATNAGTSSAGSADATATHYHDLASGATGNTDHGHDVTGTSGTGGGHTHAADAHTHDVQNTTGTDGGHTHTNTGTSHRHGIDSAGSHNHGGTNSGGDTTHDNRSQYHSLFWIMRVS